MSGVGEEEALEWGPWVITRLWYCVKTQEAPWLPDHQRSSPWFCSSNAIADRLNSNSPLN